VTDADFMRRALFHAGRSVGVTTPNPLVGAIIVSPDGVVVGQGRHPRAGEPHAEVFAIDDAGDSTRGATLFVNLEPCCHTGRTGPCTERIIAAGIKRVVAAMPDPNPLVGIPAQVFPRPEPSKADILTARRTHLGPNLSLSYRQPLQMVPQRFTHAGGHPLSDPAGQSALPDQRC